MIESRRAFIPKKHKGKKARPLAIEYACFAPIFLNAG
jgi:hypothetical protein